jgi:hypothetical protein
MVALVEIIIIWQPCISEHNEGKDIKLEYRVAETTGILCKQTNEKRRRIKSMRNAHRRIQLQDKSQPQ